MRCDVRYRAIHMTGRGQGIQRRNTCGTAPGPRPKCPIPQSGGPAVTGTVGEPGEQGCFLARAAACTLGARDPDGGTDPTTELECGIAGVKETPHLFEVQD
ncbi:hypothetical protein NDU88_003064 [Pleurodeles waltl]|uniref:Uncharacterized protein n=1 Tax=Pleurodeles waltl TaxID=8319 RepID=A0AAV7Q8S1_PLEWA|nr:hypothetical protein NDU88_003064 [Pleurodeles waltl]